LEAAPESLNRIETEYENFFTNYMHREGQRFKGQEQQPYQPSTPILKISSKRGFIT
jgi:hypothetical protein